MAVRESPPKTRSCFADYLLYVNGKGTGVIEAKKRGMMLYGVETQSDKYAQGLLAGLPAWCNPCFPDPE